MDDTFQLQLIRVSVYVIFGPWGVNTPGGETQKEHLRKPRAHHGVEKETSTHKARIHFQRLFSKSQNVALLHLSPVAVPSSETFFILFQNIYIRWTFFDAREEKCLDIPGKKAELTI